MFTTMYHKERQTSDAMIVKDNCFITEIFDKWSVSSILRGCLSHLDEPRKNKHLLDNRYCEIFMTIAFSIFHICKS